MQVAILAGGLATRLRPLTDRMPKSLVEICGKPFLEYQLDFLKTGEIGDVVLCLGYQGEKIEEHFGDGRKFGLYIRYSHERERLLGTAGALKNAEHLLKDKFIVMYSVNSAQVHIASRLSIEFTGRNLPWGVNRLYVIEKITGLALPSLDSLD